MKKLFLYCCILATTSILFTQEIETTNDLSFTDEQPAAERALKTLAQFFDFAFAKELSLSQELIEAHTFTTNNNEIDESTLKNVLEHALQILEPLQSDDESTKVIYQQLQQEQAALSVMQHKAAFLRITSA
ncbi:MAG: hypothetical protein M1114_04955 [Candidatus Dependentiae bacterium]|nr:hypothetical protein [Candidatus Dependentiae bacterium]